MRHCIWLGLLLGLLSGQAWAAGGTSVVFIPGVANGACTSWPNCPAVPNDATHAWFFAPATGATFSVTGTFWQATQPVSAASLPLPSGASTGANQTAVQSAPGTPQTTAVTIQGNASAVPVPVSPVSTVTQTTNVITTVAVSSTSVTLIASNANRKSLAIMNIGPNSCTVTTTNPAVSGAGTVYASGGPFPSQGGSAQYDSKVPTNAYYAICPSGLSTTFSIEEGN